MREANPPRVMLEGLSEQEVREVVRLALLVVVDIATEREWDALDRISLSRLEAEQYAAFNSLLDSIQRSTLHGLQQVAKSGN